mmetsp:Transcript_33847/g.82047  ORF Transcript_33847/g.82047 Transcript_33847/m.82047 type:complete len:82 (-) Transcript_33847:949-1194(-)
MKFFVSEIEARRNNDRSPILMVHSLSSDFHISFTEPTDDTSHTMPNIRALTIADEYYEAWDHDFSNGVKVCRPLFICTKTN